ncbi:MAG: glycosyltransferase family 4 protein [Candidatus Methanosuratus sp.]|nr:glycosyltransferase family 4 protein [Candidatus Methanosuratincola sp.]
MGLLLVSSSRIGERFPQRSEHLYRELKVLGHDVILIEAYDPIKGILGVLRHREVRCKIVSGFRAGFIALLLKPLIGEYFYDLVEWKADLCRDNWSGAKRVLIPLVELAEIMVIKKSRVTFNAGHTLLNPMLKKQRNVVIAENGYNDRLFDPKKYDRAALRGRLGVNFPLVIFVGKLTPMYAKYLIPAIDAMTFLNKEFKNAELWIYGDGPCKKELQKRARKGGGNVLFKGYIPHEKVPEIITIADLGINAYRTESLKLREWVAMGLPVLAPPEVEFPGVRNSKWVKEEIASSIVEILKEGRKAPVKLNTWRETAEIIASECKRLNR